MIMRRLFPLRNVLGAAALVACIALLQFAAQAQTLTPATNPSSGLAGFNDSYVTGSGFPAGAITGASVVFGTSCAAPAVAVAPVIAVSVLLNTRRFEFLIPVSLAAGKYFVWVKGTAGTTPFNTLNTPSCSTITVTTNVTGTASLGAAIGGGLVTLVDANGNILTGTTASDGTFAFNSAGLTPPFLVRVVTTSASGSFLAGTTLYSVSADGNPTTHMNVHVLSDLILRSFYSAQGIDPDTAFGEPNLAAYAPPTPVAVQSIATLVIPAVQLWLTNAGVNATAGPPANGSINLLSSPFTAYPAGVTPTTGLDAVLHIITSETIDPGNVTGITIASGTVTEIITPTYSGGDVTLSTTTTDSATGGSSGEVFTGLAVTSADQSVITGINATLATFISIVNTNGSALTGAELLPIYAPDYLNDGQNATQAANAFVANVAGITITSLQVQSIISLNTTTNVANIIAAFNITQGGQSGSGTQEWIFKDEGGTWLLYGDQQVGQVYVNAESRTSQGSPSLGAGATTLAPGVLWQTDIFAGAQIPVSAGVTNVQVSGPVPAPPQGNIWGSGVASATLTEGALVLQNGQTFDSFYALSRNQGSGQNIFHLTSQNFTFNLTSTASGNPQYTVQSNGAATTEAIRFTGISNTAGSGPLSSVVGKTITYNWTLPTTYTIGQVNLYAYIYDGPQNSPTTHSCDIGSGAQLGVTATSGSITIPANMSACGLSSSDQIKAVNQFLEVDGVNGEENIVLLVYPY